MFLVFRTVLAASVLSGLSGFAQPVVSGAVNSASYLVPPKGNTAIAQGSIFTVFGTGLGPVALNVATSFPLTTTLNGVSISVTSGGQTVGALMVNSVGSQASAILPSTTPVGPATLTATYNGQTSKPININVVKYEPGIYTENAQGSGPSWAQVAASATDIKLSNLATPGQPNSVMIIYGTGFGPISTADNTPPGAVDLTGNETVKLTVGGVDATVLYAGRAPQFPGEDQINFQLPANVPKGCYTPAVVTVNGFPSNSFTLSTSSEANSCDHPFGLSPQTEAALDAGGTANLGVFAAVRGAVPPIVAEGAGGLFEDATEGQVYATYETLLTNFDVVYFPGAVNQCVVYDSLSKASSGPPIPDDFTAIGSKELQPAASLTLSGPNSASQGIIRAGKGTPGSGYLWVNIIGAATPAVLGEGTWTLAGDAGPDMSAFSASTQFPTNLTWTNMGSLTAPPRSGVTLTWTGGGVDAQKNVWIFGNSTVYNTADPTKSRGKSFSCIVPASAYCSAHLPLAK